MKKVRETYRGARRAHVRAARPRRRASAARRGRRMRIETALARLQQDEVFRRDPHNVYHRIDRAGLGEGRARPSRGTSYLAPLGIGEVTAITVNDPAYYAGLVKLLRARAAGGAAPLPDLDRARRHRAPAQQGVRRRGLHHAEGAAGVQGAAAALAPLRAPGRRRPRRAAGPALRRGPLRRRLQGPRGRARPRR